MKITAAFVLALLALAPSAAEAQYNYGGGGRGGSRGGGEGGFILSFEAGSVNPRNADNVVATDIGGSTTVPVIPSWDNGFAGRIGLGWAWGNGSSVSGSYWAFSTETEASDSGSFAFAIGPPISDGAQLYGDIGGFFRATTEIDVKTTDVAWGIEHELVEGVDLEWTLGLRHARFEETQEAVYDEAPAAVGFDSYAATKSNEGDMIGARAGLRGSYRFGSLSVGAGLAFSFLDGKLTGSSRLVPTGSANGGLAPSAAAVEDDGRSGRITDFDVRITWHQASDTIRVWGGWEQSQWDDIAADMVRNSPGTVAPLRERASVSFSGYKLGVRVRF